MHTRFSSSVVDRSVPSSPLASLRSRIVSDSLYRNSILLIVNSGLLAGFGMAFWTLASRSVSAEHIGHATAFTSFTMFAATAVTLGLPNLVMKSMSSISNQRAFVAVCCAVIVAFGGGIAAIWIALGGRLGGSLSKLGTGPLLWVFVVVAVIVPAVSNVIDATIIARRESQNVLIKNVCGSLSKLVALPFVVFAGARGLFGAYVLSAIIATSVAVRLLLRSWRREEPIGARTMHDGPALLEGIVTLRRHMRFALGNHVGVLVAMLPISTLPLVVVARLGASTAAYVAIPMMILALLNVVASMTSQSLFAELAHGGDEKALIRKAIRAAYTMLLPMLVAVFVMAPVILNVFGPQYSKVGSPVLRWLAVAALFGCANYIADTVLIARGRVAAYTALNVAGTVSAMAFPILGLRYGVTGFGVGWFFGQIAYAACAWCAIHVSSRRRPSQQTTPPFVGAEVHE